MKRQMSGDDVRRLFSEIAESLVEKEVDNLNINQLSFEERLNVVSRMLVSEGFTVEWEKIGDEYHLRETNCPFLHIGQNHPEVCAMDQTLISTVLSVPAEKVRCILDGDAVCTYIFPMNAITEI